MGRKPSIGSGHLCIEAVRSRTDFERHQTESTLNDANECIDQPFQEAQVTSLHHSYPFRFIVPENCTPSPCRWVYPLAYGGGLVGGDQVQATFSIGPRCACLVTSQESTKVYHCDGKGTTRQHFKYKLNEDSMLCILQDPVVCFKGANFEQSQVIELTTSSNLVYLDWMLSGRNALSESWSFDRYMNSFEVHILGELVLKECLELEDTPYQTLAGSMDRYKVSGICVVLGNYVQTLSEALLSKYGRTLDLGEKGHKDAVVSVSPIRYTIQEKTVSGCYLRFLAISESVIVPVINDITRPLLSVLGADPYLNKF